MTTSADNLTNTTDAPMEDSSGEFWMAQMCEIQGALVVASLFQVCYGTFMFLMGLDLSFVPFIVLKIILLT